MAAQTDSLADAVRQVLKGISGTYALAVLDAEHPDAIIVARNGGPVVLGIGEREMFVASDPAALVVHTKSVVPDSASGSPEENPRNSTMSTRGLR